VVATISVLGILLVMVLLNVGFCWFYVMARAGVVVVVDDVVVVAIVAVVFAMTSFRPPCTFVHCNHPFQSHHFGARTEASWCREPRYHREQKEASTIAIVVLATPNQFPF